MIFYLSLYCLPILFIQVQAFPPFEGTERNYLRAQIARLAAATSISPQGFYTFGSGEEEEDIDMEEGMGNVLYFFLAIPVKTLLGFDIGYCSANDRLL